MAEAEAAGVTGCITISTTTVDCLEALAIAKRHPRVWCSAGVHPLHADEGPHDWEAIRRVGSDARCVAWGELGLDNHYPKPVREVQHRVLAEQLDHLERWARGEGGAPLRKPVVLHCREAFADLIPILKRGELDPTRMVFHCFTGGPTEMRALLDLGAMVSFTGVVTYRNANETREAARLAPLDRIMVETDAPFLSPEPKRGERPCRPAFVRHTAQALAELRGEPWAHFHAAINENTRKFFGIDVR